MTQVATPLIAIAVLLILVMVTIGRTKKATSTSTDKTKSGGGMMNTLRAKAAGVKQHFTLLKALAVFGGVVLVMTVASWVTTDEAPPAESGSHTLTGLCRGETYHTLFLPLYGQRQEIRLREGHTFKSLDIRVLYPLGGDGVAEYRYDGKSLIEKDGNVTEYSISSPPPGTNGFFIKIGRGSKDFKIPPGTIKVENAPKPKHDA